MEDLGLGKLIFDDRKKRDAIHIAVIPIVADVGLRPGDKVSVTNEGTATFADDYAVGVVDPFLDGPVRKGERFWLYLKPGSITSLRHEWTHPVFPTVADSSLSLIQMESEACIKRFAEQMDMSYQELMTAASNWAEKGVSTYSESYYGLATAEDWRAFWAHYENLTGKTAKEKGGFFRCSC